MKQWLRHREISKIDMEKEVLESTTTFMPKLNIIYCVADQWSVQTRRKLPIEFLAKD